MPRVWALLLAGPLLFLLAIVGVSAVLAAQGVPPDQIGEAAAGQASLILCLVLVGLAGLVWRLVPLRDVWGRPRASVLFIGAVAGCGLALAYFALLGPAMTWLQGQAGDYVPPGSVLASVSSNLWLFGVANVVLAPAVEETIYRGFALQRLTARFGSGAAIAITCVAFGLLHWSGGVWYMVLTGIVAGGVFAGLALWRGGLAAPFAAHLVLNLIEFSVAAQGGS